MLTQSEKIERIVDEMFVELTPPGLVCAITADAQVTQYMTRGHSDPTLGTAFSIDNSFPIGSLTKSFGAAAILLLRDEGRLALSQSPKDFIPELDPFWAEASLYQLLSMQSGLGADYGGSWAEQHLPLSNAELGERLNLSVIAASKPGTSFLYSNFGYMMLGRVISQVSGKDARDFILERIITPLGMTSTTWAPPSSGASTGYRSTDNTFEKEQTFSANNDGAVFGGLWSTVPDMAVWMDFLCSAHVEAPCKYDRVLGGNSRLEMQKAAVLRPIAPPETENEPPSCGAYSFGLVNFQSRTEWTIGHGGAVPGFGTHMRWSPKTGVSVFAMANLRYADLSAGCSKIIASASSGAEQRHAELHPVVERRANELLNLIRNWDDNVADSLFAENFFIDYSRDQIAKRFGEVQSARQNFPTVTVVPLEGLSAKIVVGKAHEVTFTVSTLEPGLIQDVVFGTI
jgi:CubicO group peptidase (beta-lactamase class C family)